MILKGFKGVSAKALKELSDPLKANQKGRVIFLMTEDNGRSSFLVALTDDLVKAGLNAGAILNKACGLVGGSGGGRKDLAQGGGKIPEDYDSFVESLKKEIEKI
jgi:alanyl-tRNA synthetase